ncbi:MAG TPA: tripartite tricarboxylate transporter substrate binding protein [Roseomonas sp.]|jgi:tripartite-type tricarboxylate transporter receptor subunit TctC
MMHRRGLAGLFAVLAAGPARAQGHFPDRTLRYIVPFPPGGLTDIMARLVAEQLGSHWNRAVVVENRAGGNAMIGAEVVVRAAPDGYTLLAMTMTHTVNVALYPNAPYDLLRDLAAISVIGSLPLVVCVAAESPARDLAGLVAMVKAQPVSAASSGNGSPPHLGLELFRRAAGAEAGLLHVPYRGGAPAITDLIAGHVQMVVGNLPEVLGQIRAGRLRALAVTAEQRHRLIPEVPTTAEAGLPALVIGNWTGMMVPAATPAPLRATIAGAVQAALRDPGLRARAEEGGFELLGWDEAHSAAFMQSEVRRWSALVTEAGIRPD